jgi:hypothetical protein
MPHIPDHEPSPPIEIDEKPSERSIGAVREAFQLICNQVDLTPYRVAEGIYNAKVDHLKQIGELRQVTDITSEDEQDDHFDELRRVYRQTYLSLGLSWPPPTVDDRSLP